MGYGTNPYTPIRYFLARAWAWFWGSVVALAVAGELMGLLARD